MVRGEALRQFDTLSAEVGKNRPEKLRSIILGLGTYFFLVMCFPGKSARCAAE